MARLKRKRWPLKNLTARYVCPECGYVMTFQVALRPESYHWPVPMLYGKPSKVICKAPCDAEMEYEGFIKAEVV